jgi:hypothetical protein
MAFKLWCKTEKTVQPELTNDKNILASKHKKAAEDGGFYNNVVTTSNTNFCSYEQINKACI